MMTKAPMPGQKTLKSKLPVHKAGGGLVYNKKNQVLFIFRNGKWDLPKGGIEKGEKIAYTAIREVEEETGIVAGQSTLSDWQRVNRFAIFAQWRQRYAPGVEQNSEHVFSLEVADALPVTLAPDEHLDSIWLPWREAAAKCFSWSNRDAILMLPAKTGRPVTAPSDRNRPGRNS